MSEERNARIIETALHGSTEERNARMIEMARHGSSARQIAVALGTTRSAVLGVCFRARVVVGGGRARVRQTRDAERQDAPPAERPAVRRTNGGGCRFPLWADGEPPDHRYCGAPVEEAGQPYCQPHRRRCWAGAGAAAPAPSIGARPPAGIEEA